MVNEDGTLMPFSLHSELKLTPFWRGFSILIWCEMALRTDVVKLMVSIVPGAVASKRFESALNLIAMITFEVDQVDHILARWLITEENLKSVKMVL